ncbi:lipopolysaccharide transport system ATP-binding protein [Desulforamulus putei DSM 12395]|uniref:Lipopolysaccharide transport system ATP-binding protein n=1 Tax=Desulforamulus putei DSM 12395 TaxID=1121429 RepID=A0A1M4VJR6_9FIRM|nr:ABC transporter ATP-binding protein [Desulforamulus putei]SHE69087.1 lipopolysaccharide transport system ATP-binding protein [Desulforamulus putei DSM 12395]
MSSNDIAIRVSNLSKCYHIYDRPQDRLKQYIVPRLQRLVGRQPKNYFREFWALKDVSFEVKKGETVGIIGRNGSGKSTLLQLICGTLTPTSGTVETYGRIAALLELGSGFNPEFTGRENVYMNGAVLGLSKEEIDACFDDIVAFADIGEFIDQPVKVYSSGMYVRLAFAVAISVKPQILIVDEALAVGDAKFQSKCMDRIKKLKVSGASILFVSHDVSSVRTLCDNAIWLDRGCIRRYGDVFALTAHYVEYLFGDELKQTFEVIEHQTNLVQNDLSFYQEVHAEKEEQPVNHWGTHKGIILDAGIYDTQGNKKNVFVNRERMQVRILFRVPPGCNRKTLSVAFSFKDLKGTDLIVSTTWDNKQLGLECEGDTIEVIFELENCLNTGKYMLVAAIEDRAAPTIQYYEYVEGAQYFATLFKHKYFGVFVPKVKHKVINKGSE